MAKSKLRVEELMNKRTPASRGEALKWVHDIALPFDSDDCLQWPFGTGGGGYGKLRAESRQTYAHRYICRLVHGEPPTPQHEAAHTCGRGHLGCVNPNHVRWATHAENVADRREHGTDCFGLDNGRGKLSDDDVAEIRRLRGVETQAALANRFGIHPVYVCVLQTGQRRAK